MSTKRGSKGKTDYGDQSGFVVGLAESADPTSDVASRNLAHSTNPEVERKMKVAREIMRENRAVLRELAK